MNTSAATTRFCMTETAKKKLIAGSAAAALALGVIGGGAYASWTASQGFEQEVTIAEAVQMEYTIDNGATWVPFDGTTASIGLGFSDGWLGLTPGASASTGIYDTEVLQIRQVNPLGDGIAPIVKLASATLNTEGDVFEGSTPAEASVDLGALDPDTSAAPFSPGIAMPVTLAVSIPDSMDDSYAGSTGKVILNLEVETYTI
ncbi:SipW-dependent-type signal peptide-containing protein [Leucobacter salsicius]|uniref:SipW-dependent-type signal peptide-containing protein n=1 Tax=Leucobacter salsicius TaxID=664638 RepID=UPI00034C6D0F|nr:SipW-dependent-type signal peptide-containing protein [Leucobacter salsicius]